MGIQPLGTSSGSILKLLLFPSFCTSSRKIPFASLFYKIFLYYFMPQGKGRQPLGTILLWKQEGLVYLITGCMFQKISLPSDIMHIFFMILYMYIALGQGQTTHWDQSFDVNRKALSLWSFVKSFKTISSTSGFMHNFSWFYTCM